MTQELLPSDYWFVAIALCSAELGLLFLWIFLVILHNTGRKISKPCCFLAYAVLGSANIVSAMVWFLYCERNEFAAHAILGLCLIYIWLFKVCAIKRPARN